MMRITRGVMVQAFCSLLIAACGQGDPVFPTSDAEAQCGDWYPGASPDAGQAAYGFEVGSTFPCLAWETARVNLEDAFFNAGELFLEAKHGLVNVRALVIALVGANCVECQKLIFEIAAREEEFAALAVMIGVCRDDLLPETTIEHAEEVLIWYDGWPQSWVITNDAEKHLSRDKFNGVPWVFVVRLEDMKVVGSGLGIYGSSDVDELIAYLQTL